MAFMEAIRQKLGWRRPLDSATPPSRQIPKTRPDASKGADPFDQHHRAGSEVRTVDLTSLHSGVAFSVTLVLGQSVAIKTKHGLYHFTLGSGTAAFLGVRNQDGDIPMPVFMSASILANLEFKIERVENTENQFNISPLSKIPHTSEPYYLRPGDAVEIEINDKVYVLQRSPHADCYILHNGIERKFDNCSVSNQRKNEILNDVLIEIVERNDGELGARLSVLQDTKATVCMPVDMIVKPEIVRPMVYQKSDEGRKIVESLNAYFASKDFAEHLTPDFDITAPNYHCMIL